MHETSNTTPEHELLICTPSHIVPYEHFNVKLLERNLSLRTSTTYRFYV